jgi:putative membrane protein insertion efficiency factor
MSGERPSWAALPALWLVRLYQRWLSRPLHALVPGSGCRFHPTCSGYAATSLQRFGLLRGGWLATRRLCRCHPWGGSGVDEVPER